MSLKRPFVPRSDVKQWFTTTTIQKYFNIVEVNVLQPSTPPHHNIAANRNRNNVPRIVIDYHDCGPIMLLVLHVLIIRSTWLVPMKKKGLTLGQRWLNAGPLWPRILPTNSFLVIVVRVVAGIMVWGRWWRIHDLLPQNYCIHVIRHLDIHMHLRASIFGRLTFERVVYYNEICWRVQLLSDGGPSSWPLYRWANWLPQSSVCRGNSSLWCQAASPIWTMLARNNSPMVLFCIESKIQWLLTRKTKLLLSFGFVRGIQVLTKLSRNHNLRKSEYSVTWDVSNISLPSKH